MYITIVDIFHFFIMFNPGPIEQESGLEKSLIDLLCESFFAGYGYWNQRRPCHILNKHRAFLMHVSSGDSSGSQPQRKSGDTGDRNKASLRSGLSCFMILDLAFVCLPHTGHSK